MHRRLAADWAELRAQGTHARMFAVTNSAVDRLNHLARAHLVQHGELPRKGRTYRSADGGHELELRVGERVRLGHNQAVRQLDGSHTRVFNGMEGTVTRTDPPPAVTVKLDPEHRSDGRAEVDLPATYVAEPDYLASAYASTADKAQGATIDHALFAADGTGTLERGYVALSRGSGTNRIYATVDTGWEDALATLGAHTLALSQRPDPSHPAVQHLLSNHHDVDTLLPDGPAVRHTSIEAAVAGANRQQAGRDGRSPDLTDSAANESRPPGLSVSTRAPETRMPPGMEPPSLAM